MTTIGFIGSGHIGSAVAQLAVNAGHNVIMSNSRGPQTLTDVITALGPQAEAATAEQAADRGDIVVVTIPLKAYRQVPVEPLAGKVVIDTNNYYPQRDGDIDALDDKTATVSGLLQAHLPQSRVVKAFNNIRSVDLPTLARPADASDRSPLMIAGDDAAAKQAVTEFINSIGYNVYDTGSLDDSWRFERDQPAYVGVYVKDGEPAPADPAKITALLAQGQR